MFMIVEGIDKVGKTMFIDKFEKLFPIERVKLERRPKDASPQEQQRVRDWYECAVAIYSQPQWLNKLVVLDRFHLSELAYCFKRNYDVLDDDWFYDVLEGKIKKIPHVLVYLECNPEIIKSRLHIEEDDYIKQQDIESLSRRYEKVLLSKTKLSYIRLDSTEPFDSNFKQLFDFMIKANKHFI